MAIDQVADSVGPTAPAEAEVTALEAATSLVALAEAGMPSAEAAEGSTVRVRAPIAAAVLPALDLEAAEAAVAVVAVAGGDDSPWIRGADQQEHKL